MIFPVYVSILGRGDSLFSYDFIAYDWDKGHRDIVKLVFNFIVFDLSFTYLHYIYSVFFEEVNSDNIKIMIILLCNVLCGKKQP